eukprot:NODE_465_length_7087_cov_1.060962.p3 type:complete len:344 gc:universal NODE_465_length_7087_cov_1.060962:3045-4076(+)
MHLYLRNEYKKFEHRVILTPEHCKQLISGGIDISVECSNTRCFSDEEYEQVGCKLTKEKYDSCDKNTYILGLKELYHTTPKSFEFCHIYFAHAYKEQTGWKELLQKFKNGRILDLEFLKENGRRVAAFGFYAGYAGALLSMDVYNGNKGPYSPQIKSEIVSKIKSEIKSKPKVLVIGALGRCGKGAIQGLLDVGIPEENILKWDLEETKKGGPFKEILEADIFINCVYLSSKTKPFLTTEMLLPEKKLSVICDVSCDYNSANNPIPVYNECTYFDKPFITIPGDVKVISIDHLPTLLPKDASHEFASLLTPYIKQLNAEPFGEQTGVWKGALDLFEEKLKLTQ